MNFIKHLYRYFKCPYFKCDTNYILPISELIILNHSKLIMNAICVHAFSK